MADNDGTDRDGRQPGQDPGTTAAAKDTAAKDTAAKSTAAKSTKGKDKDGKGKKAGGGKGKKEKQGKRNTPGGESLPASPPARRRVALTGISSRAWEHPADRGALTALRELRGFDEALKMVAGIWNERAWRLQFLGGAIKVDHRQYPRLHRIYAEAATSLDIAELPELYVQNDRSINAMAVGMKQPFIVVNTGMLELADDDELRCLLGHELGHVRSGHAVYRTMIIILTSFALRLAWFPIGSMVLYGIIAALYEWWRKAELSADRAGLLACQDPAASLRLSMKLAGGGDLSEVDTTAFLEQAAEYERSGDLRDSVLKLLLVAFRSHPMPVARAAEIRNWVDSGAYQRILSGDYPRRADDGTASMTEDVKQAADSYRESFARSEDPLFKLLRRVAGGAGDLGGWVGSGAGRVRDWMATAGRSARDSAGDYGADDRGAGDHGAGDHGAASGTDPGGPRSS
jgi:Zn-dependent protease with chaperone function